MLPKMPSGLTASQPDSTRVLAVALTRTFNGLYSG